MKITLLGTGSPMPDPHRAGPSTLVQAGNQNMDPQLSHQRVENKGGGEWSIAADISPGEYANAQRVLENNFPGTADPN